MITTLNVNGLNAPIKRHRFAYDKEEKENEERYGKRGRKDKMQKMMGR